MAEASTYKHPLKYQWTLWYFKNEKGKEWVDNLKECYSFDFAEDFWSMYEYIKSPSSLKIGCDYYLFKKGIVPKWEDSANKNGGRWLVNIEKRGGHKSTNDHWLDLLLLAIGGTMEELDDQVCGLVLNIRHRGDKIAIWTKDSNDSKRKQIMSIGEKIKSELRFPKDRKIYFQTHKEAADRVQIEKSMHIL